MKSDKERSNKIKTEELLRNFNQSLGQFAEGLDSSPKRNQSVFQNVDDRYGESKVINQGGVKQIHETIDPLTKRKVAKATLIDFQNSKKAESFLREAWLTAALEHPNIVPVYDIGVDDSEGPYFIMKLVGGKNLAAILKNLSSAKNNPEYSLRDLIMIFLKVCEAIAYTHSKGIVHLDLKPENIQIGEYGEVLVCDWGLAKIINQTEEGGGEIDKGLNPEILNDVTLDGLIKGTPGYMAPEQINTKIGPKNDQTDIYALGGTLYSLLCLKAPFESDTVEGLLKETMAGDLQLPSKRYKGASIPQSLEAVAMKALSFKPEDRYESVTQVITEIKKWLDGFATEAENASLAKSLCLLLKRHKTLSFLIFLFFISAIFGVIKIKQNEQAAIANELKAKGVLSVALGEIRTNDSLLKEGKFLEALEPIDKILKLEPDHEQLNALKGEIHFYLQEYDQAILSFQKAGNNINSPPYKLMFELSPKYSKLLKSNEYLKAQDLFELATSFPDNKHVGRIHKYESQKFALKKETPFSESKIRLPIWHNHLKYCRLMTIYKNSNINSLNFNYTISSTGISLDLSNNSALTDSLEYIRHLPISFLNLENTGYWRLWIFSHYHLQSLNIRNTKFGRLKLTHLNNSVLKEIYVTKEELGIFIVGEFIKKRINFITD